MADKTLEIDVINDVIVASFTDKKIIHEELIQRLGNELFALVDFEGRKKIVLDFKRVEYFSSAAHGKLITLDKKVKAAKAKLRLCSLKPDIYEVFVITRLNKLFDIKDDREDALNGM